MMIPGFSFHLFTLRNLGNGRRGHPQPPPPWTSLSSQVVSLLEVEVLAGKILPRSSVFMAAILTMAPTAGRARAMHLYPSFKFTLRPPLLSISDEGTEVPRGCEQGQGHTKATQPGGQLDLCLGLSPHNSVPGCSAAAPTPHAVVPWLPPTSSSDPVDVSFAVKCPHYGLSELCFLLPRACYSYSRTLSVLPLQSPGQERSYDLRPAGWE